MGHKYFDQALSDFVNDMANGGAIRHLADLGYTVKEIADTIDYPVPEKRVAEVVWRHYVEQGIILLEEPREHSVTEKVSYVKEYGKYGKASFRKITEFVEQKQKDYYLCDFGRKRYQNETLFLKELEGLQNRDREYILGLPWPQCEVYHAADGRMTRIMRKLQESEEKGERP